MRHDVGATAGYAQKFYRLRDAGEFLVVDFVLIRRSDPLLFREVELHGRGKTWFDRRGILVESRIDGANDMAQAKARVPALASAFAMFQHLVTKERRRGRAVDALVFYQSWTLRPLVEALRLLHCPQRRVFGLRYLARDLPAEACAEVEALAFVRDLDDLAVKHERARRWFDRCIERLQAAGPGSGLPPSTGKDDVAAHGAAAAGRPRSTKQRVTMRSFLAALVAAMLVSCGGEPADVTESPTAFLGVAAASVPLAGGLADVVVRIR